MKKINLPFTLLWPHPLPSGRVLNKLESSLTKNALTCVTVLIAYCLFSGENIQKNYLSYTLSKFDPNWGSTQSRVIMTYTYRYITMLMAYWFFRKRYFKVFFNISISEFDPNFGPPNPDDHDASKPLSPLLEDVSGLMAKWFFESILGVFSI